MNRYDIITVGGGLGGSSLAKVLAESGLKVLVLEQAKVFKDRVRGEQMHPWGVKELRELGLYDHLRERCGHELPWWDMFLCSEQIMQRDLTKTTPQRAPEFSFYHPAMQETLIEAARAAGAEVRRGTRVAGTEMGRPARVWLESNGGAPKQIEARLVVGADGRQSLVRQWAGFEVFRDPPGQEIAGLLFERSLGPDDRSHAVINWELGRESALFPQGNGRLRAYLIYQKGEQARFQGEEDVARFIDESIRTGAPRLYFDEATPGGPLATFDGADTWVTHPYRQGVALIGDAAASTDPSYGEGLSLTVRDVRVLRDCLLNESDWEKAGHAYAEEHDRYYGVIHDVTRWFTQMFLERGAAADQRRAHAFPLIAEDQARVPDHLFSGPDLPCDDGVRRRFFGED